MRTHAQEASCIMAHPNYEVFDFGVTRRWLADDHVALITTDGHMNTPAINTWADLVIDTINLFPPDQPIAICQDLIGPHQGFTAEVRDRLADIYAHLPVDQVVYSTIALNNGMIRNMVKVYLRRRKFQHDHLHEYVAADVESGLDWLHQKLDQHYASV